MHLFRIRIYLLNADGSVGDLAETRYADNPEQCQNIIQSYESQYQTETAEDGTVTTLTTKKYQVRVYCLSYKMVSDKTAFFKNFEA